MSILSPLHGSPTLLLLMCMEDGVGCKTDGRSDGRTNVPFGSLGRPRIVDNVILHVIRQTLTRLDAFQQFGMRNVAGDHQRPCAAAAAVVAHMITFDATHPTQ
jgi:hypothetical protein